MTSSKVKKTGLDQLMPLIRNELAAGRSICFSPNGTSMLPMLREGRDSVVLSPLPTKLKKYDLPLYQRTTGQYILHRVVKVRQTYTCIGDNQFHKEHGVHHDQMIAVVSAFYRDGKKIQTSSLLYQIYCRVWHHTRPLRHFCVRCIRWLWRHHK